MKVEEVNGHQVIVFEDGVDDELKKNFFDVIAQDQPLRAAALQAIEEHQAVCTKVKIAIKRLELFRMETRDQLWGPVELAVQALLNTEDDIHMTFNSNTNQIRLEVGEKEEARPQGGDMARRLMELLSMLQMKALDGAEISAVEDVTDYKLDPDDGGKLVH